MPLSLLTKAYAPPPLKPLQTVDADLVVDSLLQALALYQSSTVLTLGQTQVYANATTGVCNNNATTPEASACVAPGLLPRGVRVRAPGL